ncbi:MAG: GNAT family N-acetyltransferase [Proteobacteria bacterium]|nr:GNAT family N-acetyltransferase [Pseudomonadota bacterium]
MQYELIKLNSEEFHLVQPLAVYYEYDMSRYCGHLPEWAFPKQGTYESPQLMQDLKKYFDKNEANRYPFLIKVDENPAGFVMVNKAVVCGANWNMGEFFVLAPYQRKKIGQRVALDIFKLFTGIWEVAVIPQNKGALLFWQGLISVFSHGKFSKELKFFTKPEPHQMVIYKFEA